MGAAPALFVCVMCGELCEHVESARRDDLECGRHLARDRTHAFDHGFRKRWLRTGENARDAHRENDFARRDHRARFGVEPRACTTRKLRERAERSFERSADVARTVRGEIRKRVRLCDRGDRLLQTHDDRAEGLGAIRRIEQTIPRPRIERGDFRGERRARNERVALRGIVGSRNRDDEIGIMRKRMTKRGIHRRFGENANFARIAHAT